MTDLRNVVDTLNGLIMAFNSLRADLKVVQHTQATHGLELAEIKKLLVDMEIRHQKDTPIPAALEVVK